MFNPFFPSAQVDVNLREILGASVIYVYTAYTAMILAQRLHIKNAWLAWVPIANLYIWAQMAARPWYWLVGLLIPYVNIFVVGFFWAEIAQRLGKNRWIGAAIILPIVGLFVPGYLVISTPPHTGPRHTHHA